MTKQIIQGLTLVLILFVNVVFADVPGGGVRWPAQRIQFSNISSLGKYALHLQYNYDFGEDTITSDTTYMFSEHQGSPGQSLKSFYALFRNISTDTVEIDSEDMDIIFTGIKNNKLQFSKYINKAPDSIIEESNRAYNSRNYTKSANNKLLIVLSLSAIVALIFVFWLYKMRKIISK